MTVNTKKLVLDLDETLVFSTIESAGSHSIELMAAGTPFFTTLRPGVKSFLEHVSKKYDCYIWSTGVQPYIESLWNYIGVPGFTLWGRSYCRRIEGFDSLEPYEKPLNKITEDFSRVVIVDNTPSMYSKYPLNGIPIRTWRGDREDTELEHLQIYLDWLSNQESVQRVHQSWRIETLCLRSK